MKMNKKVLVAAVAAAGVLGLSGATLAGTATSDFPVSASVAANCTIDASAGLAFGAYDPVTANSAADLDNSGSIDVTCTQGASVDISLGQGANAATGSTDAAPVRRMVHATDAAEFLTYSLYSDSGRTTVWGNTTDTDVTVTGNGATAVTTPVYGRVGQNQQVQAGNYADTVVATVTF